MMIFCKAPDSMNVYDVANYSPCPATVGWLTLVDSRVSRGIFGTWIDICFEHVGAAAWNEMGLALEILDTWVGGLSCSSTSQPWHFFHQIGVFSTDDGRTTRRESSQIGSSNGLGRQWYWQCGIRSVVHKSVLFTIWTLERLVGNGHWNYLHFSATHLILNWLQLMYMNLYIID